MLTVAVLTPEKTIFEGEVSSVKAPGTIGYFEVLSHHVAMISSLQPGKLTLVYPDGKRDSYSITKGVFEVRDNHAVVLSDKIEPV